MILGVIGGSGLYRFGTAAAEEISVNTPYGSPSDKIFKLHEKGNTLLFLSRHGAGHRLSPTEINYRANIYALKKLGAQAVVSISAVGSLREDIPPGDFVLPDQYLDMTRGLRPHTFFGESVVAHAHFADPACRSVRDHVATILEKNQITYHSGGTYVCIEGPQFSTRAESHWFRSFNIPKSPVSVIGMTAMPEARLAREAGLCYQTIAMSTDYDCWNEAAGDVDVQEILKVIKRNVEKSQRIIKSLIELEFPPCRSHCRDLMKYAVMTDPATQGAAKKEELKVILD